MEENIFSKMAARYDTPERIALGHIITKEVRKQLVATTDKSLMDYGSGTGLVGLSLTDLVQSVLLVDAAKPMVEIAESKIQQQNIYNAKTIYADFTQGIPDVKADIILLSLVLLHIPNTKQILTTLYKRLNHGGTLLIVDFDENNQVHHPKIHSGFNHDQLKNLLIEAGFKKATIHNFHSAAHLLMNQTATLFLATANK